MSTNITTLQKTLYPCQEENIFGILYWCRDYEKYNKYPATILNRFAIGIYQIHQGLDWHDGGLNKFESYCAAFLHFSMVASRLNLHVEDHWDELKIDKLNRTYIEQEAKNILYYISKAQQQLFYSSTSNKTQRSSRYKEEKLNESISKLMYKMISSVPVEYRLDGIETASKIMLGLL